MATSFSYAPSSSGGQDATATADDTDHDSSTRATYDDNDDWILFTVLTLQPWQSDDRNHLPFRAGELLEIVQREETGWWAALDPEDDSHVGWIPSAYASGPLPQSTVEQYRRLARERRLSEYNRLCHDTIQKSQDILPAGNTSKTNNNNNNAASSSSSSSPGRQTVGETSTPAASTKTVEQRALPMALQPRRPHSMLQIPPTQDSVIMAADAREHASSSSPTSKLRSGILSRSSSENATKPSTVNQRRRTTENRGKRPTTSSGIAPSASGPLSAPLLSGPLSRPYSLDEERRVVVSGVNVGDIPWYLRPSYDLADITFTRDGSVLSGTLSALVDYLTEIPPTNPHKDAYTSSFLMTFRTFVSPDVLFDMLVERYQQDHPSPLNTDEFENWKSIRLRPMQHRILKLFSAWLWHYDLLELEPCISGKLTEFLKLIVTPDSHARAANQILRDIEKLTFSSPHPPSPITIPKKQRKKWRIPRTELLKHEPADIAEQLCLMEFALYRKITVQECLAWARTDSASSAAPSAAKHEPSSSLAGSSRVGASCSDPRRPVQHLFAFCATHDKLVNWVKTTILMTDVLGRRADTIDFWIKVAEKCRSLQNFSSMSAIVTALNAEVIQRLHLSWAHTGRKSHLEQLTQINQPSGSFAAYRSLMQAAEGPCVPFIPMLLTDLKHIQDQFEDSSIVPGNNNSNQTATATTTAKNATSTAGAGGSGSNSSATSLPSSSPSREFITFIKRARWADTITKMLRHQPRAYVLAESEDTRKFIENGLQNHNSESFFWRKSQDIQRTELEHADIRRGLEAAGF